MGATTFREQSTAGQWSADLFRLAAEPTSGRYRELLAVCTAHGGAHALHGRPGDLWCQIIPPHGKPRLCRPSPVTAEGPARLEIDEDQLGRVIAAGVVDGFRRARAEDRQERRR